MTSIVICEKKLQAEKVRKAVGNKYGKIVHAQGHLLELKSPDETRDAWRTWSAGLMWPNGPYRKKPIEKTRHLLSRIEEAARGVDTIIIACDEGREGQVIGQEIVEDHLKFRGRVLRACFSAEDEVSLRKAFSELRDNSEFQGLYNAGRCREQCDQTVNLSLTRTGSVCLKEPGPKGAIGIGRVKTPVLGIICRREREILNFKPKDYFEVDAHVRVAAGALDLSCTRLPKSLVAEEEKTADDEDLEEDDAALATADPMRGKIVERSVANGLAQAATGHRGPVSKSESRKKQGPPKLFDLSTLQSAASSRAGWTASKTLEIAQSLYSNHEIITYPRGDGQVLPEINIDDIPDLMRGLLSLPDYGAYADLLSTPKPRRGKSGHFSDEAMKKYEHHAIIPNVNAADAFPRTLNNLSRDEAWLFDIISRQYMAALAPDHEYRLTEVEMAVPYRGHDWAFRNTGRVPVIEGWREILGKPGDKKGGEAPQFPEIGKGETGLIETASVRGLKTKPPARYTEGAIILAMKSIWRLVPPGEERERLKDVDGIGTPATRDSVPAGLIAQGQIMRDKKVLRPTEGGMKLFETLERVAPNTLDPVRTAKWETAFSFVRDGKISMEDTIARILKDAGKEIERIKQAGADGVKIRIGKTSKPTSKMAAAARSVAERKGIKMPSGTLTDSAKCRAFLDQHMTPRGEGDGPAGPSEKQIALARSLAERSGSEVPEEALGDSKALSSWIDAAMKKAPPRPPSEKQAAFARKIAEEKSLDVPKDALECMKACSAFIDAQMGGGKGGKSGGRARR